MLKKINVQKILGVLQFLAKIAAFMSLTMSVIIKTRILLGVSNKTTTEDKGDED